MAQSQRPSAVGIKGKYLPLEVWQAKGFNVEKIKERGEKQESEMLLSLLHQGFEFL